VFFRAPDHWSGQMERENDMAVMTSWNLFEDLLAAQDEMLRTNWGQARRPGRQNDGDTGAAVWVPAVDICESKDAYLVAVEVPGIKTGDLEITFEDGLLTIQGERHFNRAAGEKVHRAERCFGAFRRSITLPNHVEPDEIEASFQDGVLQVRVPKAQEVQAKRIKVSAGQAHPVLMAGAETSNGS
jgi:HSP20 family protein